jgi:flavin reductase (DIM6/NTAB) family NADH-FMN oxidoreductase RutF
MTDPNRMREVLGHFCSGVTIVTAILDGEPVGMTCQSFFSLSLSPPLVLFSPAITSTSYPRIRQSGAFCINVLAEDQEDICRGFARSGSDKWKGVPWSRTAAGNPIIAGVQAWIDCRLDTEYVAGDHFLTIGLVVELQEAPVRPLLYYKGAYAALILRNAL